MKQANPHTLLLKNCEEMYKFLLVNFVIVFLQSVKELETFLSPEFLEKASLSDDAKADIIIAG